MNERTASSMINLPAGYRTVLAGARAMAPGGADATLNDSAISAMTTNLAALSDFSGVTLDLGLTAALPDGKFSNAANAPVSLRDRLGIFPEFALTLPYMGRSGSPLARGVRGN